MNTPVDDSIPYASLPLSWDDLRLDDAFGSTGLAERTMASIPQLSDPNDALFIGNESPYSFLPSPCSTSVATPSDASFPPKMGGRFSRDVIRTLKKWLGSHAYHPYPDSTELETLQNQTGLNRMQITNWFANARRRNVVQATRPGTSQAQRTPTAPVDIIHRPGTPAFRHDSSLRTPLERWVDSPPENEPATVGAIARAITSDTSRPLNYAHFDASPSPYERSSASSVGTSNSSEVSGLHSSGSQSSLSMRQPRRRQVRKQRRVKNRPMPLVAAMPYQCTFCTETFRTKHDWQRHEKSRHLPLEQWVCALKGPRAVKTETGSTCCVFCGQTDPDDTHFETHHYSACQNRNSNDRTFKRKDHLGQHLRLFHDVKYSEWSMGQWKESLVDVRSRCGFCGINLSTWSQRVEHLAEHFKMGKTMADWDGEWGFEPDVLKMVESAVPPYLIEFERYTVVPFEASNILMCSPVNAYELIKIELECFIGRYFDEHGSTPNSEGLQLEACRLILASDASSEHDVLDHQPPAAYSWLRDLLMSSTRLTREAQFGPLRVCSEGRLSELTIKGQKRIFENCPLEQQLRAFIEGQTILGIQTSDERMQEEARRIVHRMEKGSTAPSETFSNWVIGLIYSSVPWLSGFKKRTDTAIQASSELDNATPAMAITPDEAIFDSYTNGFEQSNEPISDKYISSLPAQPTSKLGVRPGTFFPGDLNFYPWFVRDLTRWVAATVSPQNPNYHIPSDEEIQYQARWIIYDCDDAWNQTMADNPQWLWRFKRDTGILR